MLKANFESSKRITEFAVFCQFLVCFKVGHRTKASFSQTISVQLPEALERALECKVASFSMFLADYRLL